MAPTIGWSARRTRTASWISGWPPGMPPAAGLNRVRPLATTRAFVVDGRRCIRTRWYTARGRRVLEYWRIDGLGHAWSGGDSKGSFIDRTGPRAADVMWTFFHRHRLWVGFADPDDIFVDHDLAWERGLRGAVDS